MALVKNVEKRIWDIEGFAVTIRHGDGRDMRSDRTGLEMYAAYERAAKNSMTVAEWREQRFKKQYPGLDVDVLNGWGDTVAGNTLLGTVRDSYSDE